MFRLNVGNVPHNIVSPIEQLGWGACAPKACPLGHVPQACPMPWGQKGGGGHRGASMTGENRQLVTSEPVEFVK
jgi:hypothetical protein